MHQQVLSALYALDPTIIRRFAKAEDGELSAYFAFDPSSFRNSYRLDSEIYALTKCNTERKLQALRSPFRLYGLDPEDLTFHLKDKKIERDAPATDAELLCTRLWDRVVPKLRDAFAGSGPYKISEDLRDTGSMAIWHQRLFYELFCITLFCKGRAVPGKLR